MNVKRRIVQLRLIFYQADSCYNVTTTEKNRETEKEYCSMLV